MQRNNISLAALALLTMTACTDNQDPAGAERLWQQIHAEGYRAWERAPGYATRRSTRAPHASSVEIFVNDIVAQALQSQAPIDEWPEGSIIVKDGFDGRDLELVAAMEKRADGWFWAEWDASGDPDFSGRPGVCLSCHDSGDDWVRAFPLP